MNSQGGALCALLFAAFTAFTANAAGDASREDILAETLRPYDGPVQQGVDTKTLTGKAMCGYQGWFNCERDGAARGWVHWSKEQKPLAPGYAAVDLWPDVSELAPE
jgi:hypothetical protein